MSSDLPECVGLIYYLRYYYPKTYKTSDDIGTVAHVTNRVLTRTLLDTVHFLNREANSVFYIHLVNRVMQTQKGIRKT